MTVSGSGTPVLPHNTGGTTPVTAASPTMVAGRLLRVWVASYSIDMGVGGVSDPVAGGGAWTKKTSQQTGPGGVWLSTWWKLCNANDAAAGTTTISLDADPGGGGFDFITGAIRAYNADNGFPADPFDTFAVASSTGANPASPAITTSGPALVEIFFTDPVSDAAYTGPGGGWSTVSNDFGGFAYNALVGFEQYFSSAQTGLTAAVTRASATFAKIATAIKENAPSFAPAEDYFLPPPPGAPDPVVMVFQ